MKWYWQIYCALLLFFGYGQMMRKILTDTGGFSSRYSAAIIATVVVIMLIAQAKQRGVGKVWIWQSLFYLLSATAVISLLFAIYLAATAVWLAAGLLFVGAVALTPTLHQLYQYSFKSSQLWQASQQ